MNVVKEVELLEIKKVPVPRLTAYISFYPERARGGLGSTFLSLETEELTSRGLVDRL